MVTREQREALERQRGDLGLRVAEGDVGAVEALGVVEDQIDQVRRQDERREAVMHARARRDGAGREQERQALIQHLRNFLPQLETEYNAALANLDRLPRADRAPWSLLEVAYLSGRRWYSCLHDLWGATGADLRAKPHWFVADDLRIRGGEEFIMARACAPPRIVKQWAPILNRLAALAEDPTRPAA